MAELRGFVSLLLCRPDLHTSTSKRELTSSEFLHCYIKKNRIYLFN